MMLRIPICTGGLIAFTALAGCGGAENNPGGGTAGSGGTTATGASGGETAGSTVGGGGTEVGVGGAGPGFTQCMETPSTIAADTTSALGFSANDVLAIAGGAHPSDLAWVMSDLYA